MTAGAGGPTLDRAFLSGKRHRYGKQCQSDGDWYVCDRGNCPGRRGCVAVWRRQIFQEKTPYVIFFDSSVQGLNVGAPVVFRGVQVGQVVKVEAIFDPKKNNIDVKVMVEIVRDVIRIPEGFKMLESPQQGLDILVQHGLRASLQTQSFVTGLLLVNLDFHPNTPIKRHGAIRRIPRSRPYPRKCSNCSTTSARPWPSWVSSPSKHCSAKPWACSNASIPCWMCPNCGTLWCLCRIWY